jgi:hypothetical protein
MTVAIAPLHGICARSASVAARVLSSPCNPSVQTLTQSFRFIKGVCEDSGLFNRLGLMAENRSKFCLSTLIPVTLPDAASNVDILLS